MPGPTTGVRLTRSLSEGPPMRYSVAPVAVSTPPPIKNAVVNVPSDFSESRSDS